VPVSVENPRPSFPTRHRSCQFRCFHARHGLAATATENLRFTFTHNLSGWPRRRAHDAIAEIHHFGTRGYRWVLDADVEAAFDNLSHSAAMDRVRVRVKDKRVLALVKAFLKAGVLTELGEHRETLTGTPQGGILSPLIFNIALSVLDEHVMGPWKPGGTMSTHGKRAYRRSRGQPTWRIIRYADDFVILVHGAREDTQALREDVAAVLATLGLRLSPAKTQMVHMGDGFGFLGFRIRWKRKRGSGKWYVYTFIDDRPVRTLKAKIRALTHKTSQWDLAYVLTRLGQIMRGWAMYFRYAVAKHTFGKLDDFAFWRLAHMLRARHGWNWGQLRRHLTTPTGRWVIAADGVEFFRIEKVTVSRYPYRGNKIPAPWPTTNPA
jgi:RNA-directed DNA polymerase